MSELEAQLAVLRQRSDDQQEQIRAFGPLVSQYAVLEERVGGIQSGLTQVRDHVQRVEDECEERADWIKDEFHTRDQRDHLRAEKARKDQIALRIAVGGLFVTFAGLIVAVLQLLGQA